MLTNDFLEFIAMASNVMQNLLREVLGDSTTAFTRPRRILAVGDTLGRGQPLSAEYV